MEIVGISLSAPSDRDQQKRIGEVLNGRYRIESVIGAGGQGVVYRALDAKDGEAVAVKILRDEVATDPEWRERMFREAQAMASLLGTAAVRVLDQGWTADGAHYLVMELLHGRDLETALQAIEQRGERSEPEQLLEILTPLVGTLERAHAHGIVHRDIKPANVYLLESGGVRLLDFGFAKFTRLRGLTLTGYVAGSPSYIAPEMWLHGSDKVDQRVDVYSLAAVVFRALGGRPPFIGKSMAEVYLAATTAPRPRLTALRPELPANVDAWVDLSLAIDPDTRFSSVTAMVNALSAALGLPQTQRKGPRT
jgi:serine/threonine-protein kinase